MYKLYVDESYQDDHYYVAGVLVTEEQDALLVDGLTQLAERQVGHGALNPPEFHAHALMNGRDDWTYVRGNHGAAFQVYQLALQTIYNSGARIYVQGVDVTRLHARYKYPDAPHEIVLRHLLERVNESCNGTNESCHVVADMVPQQEDFNEAIQGYTRVATPGYRGQILTCIDGDITFVDSRQSRGVQAADLVVYLMRRFIEQQSASSTSKHATRRLVNTLGDSIVYCRKWAP